MAKVEGRQPAACDTFSVVQVWISDHPLMGFFRRRRERESAIPPAAEHPPGSFADPTKRPVVGSQVGDGPAVIDDVARALSQLGPALRRAAERGDVEVEGRSSQTIDMRGTGLREEVLAIMRAHGIDPESGTRRTIDASAYGRMQQELLAALARHGIDAGAAGPALDSRLDRGDA